MSTFWAVFLLFMLVFPWINAAFRGHRNTGAIALVNILLGWTLIGWVIALIWSATDNVRVKNG